MAQVVHADGEVNSGAGDGGPPIPGVERGAGERFPASALPGREEEVVAVEVEGGDAHVDRLQERG